VGATQPARAIRGRDLSSDVRAGLWVPNQEEETMLRVGLSVFVLAACLSGQLVAQGAPSGVALKGVKPAAIVNLNTATVAELAALLGIGSKVAERIVEYRLKKGPFRKIEELMNVQGIGEKTFLKLRPQLTVAARPEQPAQN
jgi:comEA protein